LRGGENYLAGSIVSLLESTLGEGQTRREKPVAQASMPDESILHLTELSCPEQTCRGRRQVAATKSSIGQIKRGMCLRFEETSILSEVGCGQIKLVGLSGGHHVTQKPGTIVLGAAGEVVHLPALDFGVQLIQASK
jgi:hypothetical protein